MAIDVADFWGEHRKRETKVDRQNSTPLNPGALANLDMVSSSKFDSAKIFADAAITERQRVAENREFRPSATTIATLTDSMVSAYRHFKPLYEANKLFDTNPFEKTLITFITKFEESAGKKYTKLDAASVSTDNELHTVMKSLFEGDQRDEWLRIAFPIMQWEMATLQMATGAIIHNETNPPTHLPSEDETRVTSRTGAHSATDKDYDLFGRLKRRVVRTATKLSDSLLGRSARSRKFKVEFADQALLSRITLGTEFSLQDDIPIVVRDKTFGRNLTSTQAKYLRQRFERMKQPTTGTKELKPLSTGGDQDVPTGSRPEIERTLLDMEEVRDEFYRAGGYPIGRVGGLVTYDALSGTFNYGVGAYGVLVSERAIPQLDGGTKSAVINIEGQITWAMGETERAIEEAKKKAKKEQSVNKAKQKIHSMVDTEIVKVKLPDGTEVERPKGVLLNPPELSPLQQAEVSRIDKKIAELTTKQNAATEVAQSEDKIRKYNEEIRLLRDKFLKNKLQLDLVQKTQELKDIEKDLELTRDVKLALAESELEKLKSDTSQTIVTVTRTGDKITQTTPTQQRKISAQFRVVKSINADINRLALDKKNKSKEVAEAEEKVGPKDKYVEKATKRISDLYQEIYAEEVKILTTRAQHGERKTTSGKAVLLSVADYQQQIDQLRVERARYDAESNWTEYRAEAYKAALDVFDPGKLGEIMTRAKQLELNPSDKVKELLENRDVRYKDYPDVYLVTLQLLFGDDIIGPTKYAEFDRVIKLLPPEKWMSILRRNLAFASSSVRTDNRALFTPRKAEKLNSTMLEKIVTSIVEDLNKDTLGAPDMNSRIAVENYREVVADKTLDFTSPPYNAVVEELLQDRYYYYYINENHLASLIQDRPPPSLPLPANRTTIKAVAVEYIRRKSFGII